eukprot:5852997-Pyramimonas_sp.AAC.1
MWTPPLGHSVDLPMGPRSAVLGGGDACGHLHWGLTWSSHRATKRRAGWGRRMWTPPLGP